MASSASWIPELQTDGGSSKPNPYREAALNPYGGLHGSLGMSGVNYPKDPKYPLRGTVNNEFWHLTRSGLNYYLNPDSIGTSIYEEMYTSDETCRSAMQFLVLATLAKFGPFIHSDRVIQDKVNGWLANMQTPWVRALKEILTATWAGHSTTEIIVDYDGEHVVPRQLQTLHPSTISYDLHLDGPLKNNLKAARQWRFGSYSSYLPAEKIIVFSQDMTFGNVYGQSRLRASWRSWFLKTKMLSSWAVVLDRYGSPHAVATVANPEEMVYDPTTGREYPIMDFVTRMLDQLASSGSIAVSENIKIELHQAKQAVGADFGNFIDYLDKMIYRGALIPSLVGDHGSNGSYALGSKHYDLFVLMLEEQAQQLSEVVIDQFIKRIIIANWGPQDDYGRFSVEDFQQDDEKLLAEAFSAMVDTGIVKPGIAEDLNAMRDRLGFAPLTQEQIDSQPQVLPNPGKKLPKEEADVKVPPAENPEKDKPAPAQARSVLSRPYRGTLLRRPRYSQQLSLF